MFNRELEAPNGYHNQRALGGLYFQDYETFRTLYAGQDPADPSRALVRKLVKVGSTYCYEETRVTPQEQRAPSVHVQLFRVKDFDLKEEVSPQELQLRGLFRPVPNVMGFSIYFRDGNAKTKSATLVENTIHKAGGGTWLEWLQDLRDRRDMAAYLRIRWNSYY